MGRTLSPVCYIWLGCRTSRILLFYIWSPTILGCFSLVLRLLSCSALFGLTLASFDFVCMCFSWLYFCCSYFLFWRRMEGAYLPQHICPIHFNVPIIHTKITTAKLHQNTSHDQIWHKTLHLNCMSNTAYSTVKIGISISKFRLDLGYLLYKITFSRHVTYNVMLMVCEIFLIKISYLPQIIIHLFIHSFIQFIHPMHVIHPMHDYGLFNYL
jgi:hypothetical protein